MNATTADHLIRIASAVRLLGAQVFLTGVPSVVAKAMVSLGVDLSQITTLRSVKEALRAVLWGRKAAPGGAPPPPMQ